MPHPSSSRFTLTMPGRVFTRPPGQPLGETQTVLHYDFGLRVRVRSTGALQFVIKPGEPPNELSAYMYGFCLKRGKLESQQLQRSKFSIETPSIVQPRKPISRNRERSV